MNNATRRISRLTALELNCRGESLYMFELRKIKTFRQTNI